MANNIRYNTRRSGFSLVELLVVVAIIVLLIGLLIPGLSAVRQRAKEASSQAAIGAIDAGLATYKADQEVGGAFPPSRSDGINGVLPNAAAWDIANPYSTGPNAWIADTDGVSGGGLLVMALAGADLQGAPGFRDLSGTGFWSDDCFGGPFAAAAPGTYAYKAANDRSPYFKRFGPYVQVDRIKITPRTPGTTGVATTFDISKKAKTPMPLKLPMFLDGFGHPILYYRADTTARLPVTDMTNLNAGLGTYNFEDNRFFTGDDGNSSYGVDLGAGSVHGIVKALPNGYNPNSVNTPDDLTIPDDRDTFLWYVHDPKVTTNIRPRNAKTYLLDSPGADALYGSGDDMANFEKNF